MSESNEIPAFRVVEKKVDVSWKEEIRRERELAAKKLQEAAQQSAQQPPAAKPEQTLKAVPRPEEMEDGGDAGEDIDDTVEEGAESELQQQAQQQDVPQMAKKKTAANIDPATAQRMTQIFVRFLQGLVQQTLIAMGEMPSPFSGQRELDLQAAREMIELLATIQVKTDGNLSVDEAEMLSEVVTDLRARFVELTREAQRQMAAKLAKGPMRPGPGGAIPGPGSRR